MPTTRPSSGKIHASRTVRQLQAQRAAEEAEEALRAQRPTRVAGWRSVTHPADAFGTTSTWTSDTAAGHVRSAAEPLPGVPTWDVTARDVPTQVRRIPRKDLALAGALVTVLVAAAGLVATSGGDDRITIEDAAVSLTPAPSTSRDTSPSASRTDGPVTDPATESSGAPVADPGAAEARVGTRRSVGTTAWFDREGPSSFADAAPGMAPVPVPPVAGPGPVAPPPPPVPSETTTTTPSETTTTTPSETTTTTPSETTTTTPPLPTFPPLPPLP